MKQSSKIQIDKRSKLYEDNYFVAAIDNKNKRIINVLLHHFDSDFTKYTCVAIATNNIENSKFLITEFI